MRKIREIAYAGSRSSEETERERKHRNLSAKAAAEGMVLLKNDGMLPLKKGIKIALYGPGARRTVMGGTGSGDVNERYSVSIEQGLENAGYVVTSKHWLDEYDSEESAHRKNHYKDIFIKASILQQQGKSFDDAVIEAYTTYPAYIPGSGPELKEEDAAEAYCDTAIYVLSRNAGEGKDRVNEPGDYQLSVTEKASISFLREHFKELLVVINSGGVMDLGFMDDTKVNALLAIHQPGMEAGNAFADIVSGKETPSGKLTDSWAMHYEDYPNSATYSHISGDTSREYYHEGIYVGYRYFDKAGVLPRYPFGYGLSYTQFSLGDAGVSLNGSKVRVSVKVTNVGDTFSGKEVVQVYITLPDGRIEKEIKRLVGFTKTRKLSPGESEDLVIEFDMRDAASYDEGSSSYVLEAGYYGVMVGTSVDKVREQAYIRIDEEIIVSHLHRICPLKEDLQELSLTSDSTMMEHDTSLPVLELSADVIPIFETDGEAYEQGAVYTQEETAEESYILDRLSPREMAYLVCGAGGQPDKSNIGMSAVTVPGAAGETTSRYVGEPWHLANIVLADGPAGLRLAKNYQLDPSGKPYKMGIIEQFMGSTHHEEGTDYYQYCTRIPSGTLLAQSFNTELVQEMGKLVAEEMNEFHITLWLAPGMNIHRNPLCGRNFEYYSEDPLLSGKMAAALTRGVQSLWGVGTTIKHFVCNEQEDNRQHCDSIVSERALREIYMKGFEIAIRESAPKAVMTSYDLVNGIHSANNYDLCTNVLRREWGFQGVVMTDWSTTGDGGSKSGLCIRAGNDLVMPGSEKDVADIQNALALTGADDHGLTPEALRASSLRVVRTILNSNRYEDEN